MMSLISVRRLLVALAVCLVGTNKYGLVGADLDGCYAKCPTDVEGNRDFYCGIGCRYMTGFTDRTPSSTQVDKMTVNGDVSPTDGIPTVSDLDQ